MNTQSMSNKLDTLTEDAQRTLHDTDEASGDRIAAASHRLRVALERSKEFAGRAREKAIAGAKATDTVVRENPYQAMGIALLAGAVLGYFLGRRQS